MLKVSILSNTNDYSSKSVETLNDKLILLNQDFLSTSKKISELRILINQSFTALVNYKGERTWNQPNPHINTFTQKEVFIFSLITKVLEKSIFKRWDVYSNSEMMLHDSFQKLSIISQKK